MQTLLITREAPYKRRDGPYEKGRSLTRRAGVPYGSFTERDDEEGIPLQGGSVLMGRADRLTGSLTRRNGPYGKGGSLREGPGSLREGPGSFTGLGPGNFPLCAVDQKKPFFPRVGPFLDLPPFKEAYGKAGPLQEARLRGGTVLTGRAAP